MIVDFALGWVCARAAVGGASDDGDCGGSLSSPEDPPDRPLPPDAYLEKSREANAHTSSSSEGNNRVIERLFMKTGFYASTLQLVFMGLVQHVRIRPQIYLYLTIACLKEACHKCAVAASHRKCT